MPTNSIRFLHWSLVVGLHISSATSIKWTPAEDTSSGSGNNSGDKPNAATAPKSQRYWDEHGIERPDYAKTDAEVARERTAKYKDGIKSATETLGGKLILGVTIVGLFYLYLVRAGKIVAFWDKGSFRLGGSRYASSSLAASREEARNARLARFDQKQE